MPLALTDAQLSAITAAAALLPPAARDNFLRSEEKGRRDQTTSHR